MRKGLLLRFRRRPDGSTSKIWGLLSLATAVARSRRATVLHPRMSECLELPLDGGKGGVGRRR
jgi:hypothetical protein